MYKVVEGQRLVPAIPADEFLKPQKPKGQSSEIHVYRLYEPVREKTNNVHMRKQRRRSASQ